MSGALRAVQRQARRVLGQNSKIIAGQPTPDTHPELLQPGEIQPGISSNEFSQRRHQLAQQLPEGGIAVLQSAPQTFMAGVIPYPYRQDADFHYLTGIIQPGPVATIQANGKFTLFYPDRDSWRETWDGTRLSQDATLEYFGADEAFPLSEMPQKLSTLLANASSVALDTQRSDVVPLASAVSQLPAMKNAEGLGKIQSLRHMVHRLRWIKSPAELELMRQSAGAAAAAMSECMKVSTAGVKEHNLAALFEYKCRTAGAQRMSYPPVVAGGVNACTIHYSRNDRQVPGNEMILLDGGCELYGYCSDVTRTWPVGGTFSGAQAAVYNAVLDTHHKLLQAVRPGATLRQLHHASIRLLSENLANLGVINGATAEALMNSQSYRTFYPHSVGHWLGMDTHDAATMSHDRPLEAGVVLTIEPGLYIPDREEFGALAGIGVRLEDDVAVTIDGAEVLSAAVPLEPKEVEAMVGSGL
jgi:Xaa-Pro aminopeptidase